MNYSTILIGSVNRLLSRLTHWTRAEGSWTRSSNRIRAEMSWERSQPDLIVLPPLCANCVRPCGSRPQASDDWSAAVKTSHRPARRATCDSISSWPAERRRGSAEDNYNVAKDSSRRGFL